MMCRKWVTTVGLSAGLALLAACGPAGSSDLSATTTAGTTASPPVIGLLVGTDPADHVLPQARTWAADAKLVAEAAGSSGAHVVLDRFGAGPGSSDVMYNARVASTTGLNSLIINTQLQEAEKRLERAFAKEQASTTRGPINLISGVQSMAQHFQALAHRTTDVVIFGDAVQTAVPVNLADPLQLADPKATLQSVMSLGMLSPDECRGWRVYMVDGSLTPAGGLSTLQDEQLREFWREFFASCGGRLAVWDSTLIAFPASGEVPAATWTSQHRIIIPLAASVLFRSNQAVLLPSAGQILDQLARKLTITYPRATAEIAGYTAAVTVPSGPPAMVLSRARAQAVAAYLEARGVGSGRLSVQGYGDQDQIPGGPALNRRVVVTLYVG
jgi:outer membrane protein OmpA-like peptidoglycan-associated protein